MLFLRMPFAHGMSFEPGSKLSQIAVFAFNNCRSLCEIEIPSQVEILLASAFHGCDSLSRLTVEMPSRLRQLELPQHHSDI
jgi:hypothetical protein